MTGGRRRRTVGNADSAAPENRRRRRFGLPRRAAVADNSCWRRLRRGCDRRAFPARCLHAGVDMQSIIGQNAIAPALPDFRNLGTILRIVLAVNAMTAVAALVREPQFDLWTAQWLDMTAVVEPHLIVELAILYALAPWLSRQPPLDRRAAWSRRSPSLSGSWSGGSIGRSSRESPLGPAAAPAARALRVRRAARLFRAPRQGAVAGDRRIAAAGAAGADPPAFPVQQHQCGAVPRALRPEAGGNRAPRHGRPLPRADARQPRAGAARRRNRALPAVPRAREAAAHRPAARRMAPEQHAGRRAGAAARPAAAARERRLPRHRAVERARASCRSTSSTRAATCTRSCATPTRRTAAGTMRATRWRSATSASVCKLHFDAEGALESRVRDAAYEVHIRMPYRTRAVPAPAPARETTDERALRAATPLRRGPRRVPTGRRSRDGNRDASCLTRRCAC